MREIDQSKKGFCNKTWRWKGSRDLVWQEWPQGPHIPGYEITENFIKFYLKNKSEESYLALSLAH